MSRTIFATLAIPSKTTRAGLLFESLRTFGGELASSPTMLLVQKDKTYLSDYDRSSFYKLNVRIVPFEIPAEAGRFPLASLVYAASEAEKYAAGEYETLTWMNDDTLITNPPVMLFLPDGKNFAYRPVHHNRIGSEYSRPPDAFWSLIYQHCGVAPDKIFPMETCSRDETLRPHFNAGLIVTRPRQHLLERWQERFELLYHHPDFEPLFRENNLYRIFMHQAVLSAVTLSIFDRQEMLELPENVNYPLHLHSEYPVQYRPAALNDLITCRYEEYSNLEDNLQKISTVEPLRSWLNERLKITR